METRSSLSNISRMQVVTRDRGRILGTVEQVYLDPAEQKLSAFTFRNRFTRKEQYVIFGQLEVFGQDILLIASEDAARPYVPGEAEPPGRNVRELKDLMVATFEGRKVGKITDVEIQPESGTIVTLYLSDRRKMPIEPGELMIGPDQALVRAEAMERMVAIPPGEHAPGSLLDRLLAQLPPMDEVAESIRKKLRRKEEPPEGGEPK